MELLLNLGAGSTDYEPRTLPPADHMRRVESSSKAVDAFAALYPHLMPRAVLQ